MSPQTELERYGARAYVDVFERAREYRKQLDEISSPRLQARFWDMVVLKDPAAAKVARRL